MIYLLYANIFLLLFTKLRSKFNEIQFSTPIVKSILSSIFIFPFFYHKRPSNFVLLWRCRYSANVHSFLLVIWLVTVIWINFYDTELKIYILLTLIYLNIACSFLQHYLRTQMLITFFLLHIETLSRYVFHLRHLQNLRRICSVQHANITLRKDWYGSKWHEL